MSEPTKQPTKQPPKDRHKKENGVPFGGRIRPDLAAQVIEYQVSTGIKTRIKVMETLFEKGLSNILQFVEYHTCRHRSVIMGHPEVVRCNKEGYWRNVEVETECMIACRNDKILKIARDFKKMEDLLNYKKYEFSDLTEKLEKAKTEYAENTVPGLRAQVDELKDDLETSNRELFKVRRTRDRITENVGLIVKDNNRLRQENDLLKNPAMKPTEETQTIPQNIEQKPQIVERVTEKKEIITEKFVPQQPSQCPTPMKMPSELVLCPIKLDHVSVDDVCKKCETFAVCPQYGEYVMLKKAIRNQ